MRFGMAIICAGAALCCGTRALAAPAKVTVRTRVAHETQFPSGCTGSVYGPVLQRNALTEPHLAVDPHDAHHVVVTWAQDTFSQPAVAQSHDGGRHFETTLLRSLTKCTG